jgi:hypothetical protein
MDDPAEIEIDYITKPTGFDMVASLSRYYSIPLVICIVGATLWVVLDFARDWSEGHNPYRVVTFIIVMLVLVPFWWSVLLSASGTQRVSLDFPDLEVTIGIGSICFKYKFDIRNIRMVTEEEYIINHDNRNLRRRSVLEYLPIHRIEFGSPTPSIVLKFIRPIDALVGTREDVAFGRHLNIEQRSFILRKLREAVRAAT